MIFMFFTSICLFYRLFLIIGLPFGFIGVFLCHLASCLSLGNCLGYGLEVGIRFIGGLSFLGCFLRSLGAGICGNFWSRGVVVPGEGVQGRLWCQRVVFR